MRKWRRLGRLAYAAGIPALVVAAALAGQGQAKAPASEDVFAGVTFRNIGPALQSGRIDDFAVYEKNPAIFYVATATGGLWKTTNNGTTWEVLFDDLDDVVSIGDVTIANDDPNLVWVGTGENNNRNSSSWGKGIYKSTDVGRTWVCMGLEDTKHIGRVVVDPRDHDIVYVAATGHLWGPNNERGVFRTTDGGVTWAKVLFVDDNTGATDIAMDPANNKVLYAAMYQRRRAIWGFNGGGPGSGLYKSADAGRTWTRLTNGIPAGSLGRIGLDVYRANPNVVYARIEHETEGGLYRSDDAGTTWRKMSDVNPRPMYFGQVRIDPNDDHRIYVLGVLLHISDDGGRTFSWNSAMHGDHHAMWINPANSNHVLTGSDGGVGISWDRGRTWDFIDNMDLGQFYHVGYDMDWPYRVYGGMQDNESVGGPSQVRSTYGHYHGVGWLRKAGIQNGDWFLLGGGDGFVALADPTDSRILYNESQGGNLFRVDRLTNERKSIKPQQDKGEAPLRWNWNTPVALSPHAPATVFAAANRLYMSPDRGSSWQAVSPDLTAAVDRAGLSLMGVPEKEFRIARHDGVSVYGTLVTFHESPKKAGVFYTGADDGTVHVSPDGGRTWTNITTQFPGLPKGVGVARIAASAFDERTAYAAFDGHQADDYTPYIYATTDLGHTWRSIASDLPAGRVVRCITEDHRNPDVLYAGTECGLFVSIDRGLRWSRVVSGLPTVPIYEIALHPRENDMIVATHGRSIWILDDLTPFQQAREAQGRAAYLFESRPAVQFVGARDRIVEGDRKFWGRNPEFGAGLTYFLEREAAHVELTIRDAGGQEVRRLGQGLPDGTGIHRVYWDLRHERLPQPRGYESPEGFFSFDPLDGPFVLPGEYEVSLVVDGRSMATRTITVNGDPLVGISAADRETLHEAAVALHAMQRAANEAANAVRLLSEQLSPVQASVKALARLPAAVAQPLADVTREVETLAQQLGVASAASAQRLGGLPGQIGNLKTQLMGSTTSPTDLQFRLLRTHREDLTPLIERVNAVIGTGMPALYRALGASGVYPPLPPAVKLNLGLLSSSE